VNAINIPVADMENRWTTIESYKNKPVIIYLFTSGTGVHEAARSLYKKGLPTSMFYREAYLILDGLQQM
jgi:rhodanese-related sulfurtransferase